MNIEDFRYMWRGKHLKILSSKEANLLSSIDKRGSGHHRALLLLHGFSSSPAVFRELLPSLSFYDAIVCPALPGHGESINAFSVIKYTDWLTYVETLCASLVSEYEQVDIVGFSLGGLLACHLSKLFPLHHLYLLAPALALCVNAPRTLKVAEALRWLGFKFLRNRAGNLRSTQFKEIAYKKVPLATIIEILTFVKSFEFAPPNCPVDLFLGRFDEVVSSTKVAKQFENVPNTTIHWLENSAHVLPLDADLASIVSCIRSHSNR